MQMTPDKILVNFNQAKDPPKQVQILAELNATSVANIKRILLDLGVDPKRLPWGRPKATTRRAVK